MLLNKKNNTMKKFLSMTFCLFFFASCLPVWDTMESMRIKNSYLGKV